MTTYADDLHVTFIALKEAVPDLGRLAGYTVEALEALLQLEDQVAENRVVLHWPQGQSLRLAGRGT